MLLVFATAQISGVKAALVRGMTDSLMGHLQIKPKTAALSFFDVSTGRRLELIEVDELSSVLKKVRALPAVEAASPRMSFGAVVGNGESSTPAMVIAVETQQEQRIIPDMAEVLPLLDTAVQAALVSPYLVEKSGVPLEEEILVLTETPSEVFNGRPYDIKGYARSPHLIDEFMNAVVFTNLERTRKMLYVESVATDIVVRIKPQYLDRLPEVVAQVREALSSDEREHLAVYTYREVAQVIGSVGSIATGMATVQVGVVIFVMLIVVLILTKISLHERRREIGTLMSLGMTRERLVRMFAAEVVLKVLIGYVLGFAVAMALLLGIRQTGGLKAETLVEQYMNGGKVLLPVLDLHSIVLGLMLVLGVSLLATLASCWQAANEDVVSLLRTKE